MNAALTYFPLSGGDGIDAPREMPCSCYIRFTEHGFRVWGCGFEDLSLRYLGLEVLGFGAYGFKEFRFGNFGGFVCFLAV